MNSLVQTKVQKMTLTAVFAALACVATLVIQIPSPTNGYIHMGDTIVLLAAFVLGPWYGSAAAGIGSAFADLITGYVIYVPGTLVIKAFMALAAGLIGWYAYKKNTSYAKKTPIYVTAGIVAEAIMVVGYYIYAGLLLGDGLVAALSSIPSNLVQAAFGIAAAMLLYSALVKIPGFAGIQKSFIDKE